MNYTLPLVREQPKMHNYEENLNGNQKDQFLDHVSDSEMSIRLGISNWNEKLKSYTKPLNNNEGFSYDGDGIYFVDKLSVAFKSDDVPTIEEKYHIGDISLIRERGIEKNYYQYFRIYIGDSHFGYINFRNTRKFSLHKIEIVNEMLYVKSKIYILEILYKLASHFNFTYSNISEYELARDSVTNYYDQFICIYNQSKHCSMQIYKIYGGKPKYSFFGSVRDVTTKVDKKDTSYGTALIGSNKSDTQLKLYVKSNELKKWADEKNYINEIHYKFFKDADTICRVEVKAKSKAINKRNLDVFDILISEKHPQNN